MSNPDPATRAWVDVDLAALLANARTIQTASGVRLLPMVKANAYGLGVVPVTRALEALDPWGYGVATVSEGAELRDARIARPIVVFSPFRAADTEGYLRHGLRPSIGDRDALLAWLAAGGRPFHLDIDTGMSRSGFRWDESREIAELRPLLDGAAGWEGIYTHFHSSERDPAATERQWQRFMEVLAAMPRRPQLIHAANSGAALRGPRYAGDLVRPGIFLYGGRAGEIGPRPVAALRARVLATRQVPTGESVSYGATWSAPRDTLVATVGVGYADGVHRSLSGVGTIELGRQVVPIVGRVTMDFTMVAAPAGCVPGDVATIFGGLVSLDAQAEAAGTISYELLTALGGRLARRYDET